MSYNSKLDQSFFVSADDFGANPQANKAILELVNSGKLDRVAIMANGDFSSEEVQSLLDSGVKLDIHLDFASEAVGEQNPGGNTLMRVFLFLKDFLLGEITPQRVENLWENQIEKFHNIFGRYPDGINSHQHVHFFPPYFKIALKLAKKYHTPFVRFGKFHIGHSNLVSFILDLLKDFDRKKLEKAKLASTDFMLSADWIPDFDLKKFAPDLSPEKSLELIFHPERSEEFLHLKNSSKISK